VAALVGAPLAAGCTAPGAASPSGGGAGSAGTTAPDFTARTVDGSNFRLSSHLGKQVVLLDFMATFCEPCKAELPQLRAIYDRHEAEGLLVVGVAMDGPETVADVPAFVRRFELGFPVVLDQDSSIASRYDPRKSMPFSVLIDRSGRIVREREGYDPGDEKLVEADVEKALATR